MTLVLFWVVSACGSSHESADSVLQSLSSSSSHPQLLRSLISADGGVPLVEIVKDPKAYGLTEALCERLTHLENWEKLQLEMPLAEQAQNPTREALFLFVPDVPESSIRELSGYDARGKKVVWPVDRIPEQAVITLSMREDLQPSKAVPLSATSVSLPQPGQTSQQVAGEAAHKLNRIRFQNTSEPWFKGVAEIYMVVAYFDAEGKGSSKIVNLRGVDYANHIYDINKIFHFWNESKHQIVDIAFFEHDSNYNYTQLTKILIRAASAITSAATGGTAAAIVVAVSSVLDAAIAALPADTMTDKDDFLDAINTVEMNKTLTRFGVRQNAQVDISLYDPRLQN